MIKSAFEIGIVGNPNCGKTTLFNVLTGAKQTVGNWPGVTVEQKRGEFQEGDSTVTVVDLPGTYSLTVVNEEVSLDERLACDYILSKQADLIVNVIDASNLERNLYLTMQLMEMGVPVVVALNMIDVARKRNLIVDPQKLASVLGCPVVPMEAANRLGVDDLKEHIVAVSQQTFTPQVLYAFSAPIERSIDSLIAVLPHPEERLQARWRAIKLLEGDFIAARGLAEVVLQQVHQAQATLSESLEECADVLIAAGRYQYITDLVTHCCQRIKAKANTVTSVLDNIVLNRFLGIPFFLLVMYAMFLFAINVGGAFQDFFDIGSDVLFVQFPASVLTKWHAPSWCIALIAGGVGKGINTVVTFIPVIGGMFLFLAFLEQSGYMARAAFVMDRFMRAVGLPGKSFVPMIVGFGCNVPAVMASRTLENRRDRILTVLMSPFMSCGARLAIFAVFTTAFFPQGGANVIFALYMIGIIVAILTGLALRKTLLKGTPAPFVMELPAYHCPRLHSLMMHTWHRLRRFVRKAGRLIIPICVLLGGLNALTITGHFVSGGADNSLLAVIGKVLTPLFSPLGIHADNWPATVGLFTGILAKEVVVGTLNSLYSQVAHIAPQVTHWELLAGLKAAVMSIPQNFIALKDSLFNPVLASAPDSAMLGGAMGQMYQRFDGGVGAFAYLLFVLLYFPCISTTAVMSRELGRAWAWFSVFWTTGAAYGIAVIFYQVATIWRHPLSSSLWIAGMLLTLVASLVAMKLYAADAPQTSGLGEGVVL